MKKIMLSVAFVASTLMFANAQTPQKTTQTSTAIVKVAQAENDFKEVKLESLNEKVQATIKSFSETYTMKALAYNAEKKLTKVTLVSKADSKEKVILLDEQGKEVKENK